VNYTCSDYFIINLCICYRCHAIGSRSEITVACLVSFTCKIFTEKSYITNHTLSTDNEESCKQWFLDAVPCLCNIETNTRLKPKQLFYGKYILLQIHIVDVNSRQFVIQNFCL